MRYDENLLKWKIMSMTKEARNQLVAELQANPGYVKISPEGDAIYALSEGGELLVFYGQGFDKMSSGAINAHIIKTMSKLKL